MIGNRVLWKGTALAACLALPLVLGFSLASPQAPGGAETTDPGCAAIQKLSGTAREEILAVARILALKPAMAIDFTKKSGEYCLNTGGPVMTHFSVKPDQTAEDIVTFVDVAPLVAKGLRLEEFPPLPGEPGKMQPGTWYRYEGEATEPHHGMKMSGRTWLVVAVDVK